MGLFDDIQSVAGVPQTQMATMEQTGAGEWRVDVPDSTPTTINASDPGEARVAADAWFLSQGWKRFTRWDPDTGSSGSCRIML